MYDRAPRLYIFLTTKLSIYSSILRNSLAGQTILTYPSGLIMLIVTPSVLTPRRRCFLPFLTSQNLCFYCSDFGICSSFR